MKRAVRLAVAAALLAGCSAGSKESLVRTALEAPETRQEAFEAVLRVLDDDPELVDQLYRQARGKHRRTIERFVANTAADLHEEELAKLTAKHLVANPAGLRQILVATLEAAGGVPAARSAIAQAVRERHQLAADIITDDPEAAASMLVATVEVIADKPAPRRAFVVAMGTVSPTLAGILAGNPKLLGRVVEELALELKDDPEQLAEIVDRLSGDEAGGGG